jgi:hypothetical protein
MRYTEPVATLDAGVLVVVPAPDRLDVLSDIYQYWEAVLQAETADFEGVPFRVVRPEHLAVIALSVGRAKDFTRILALLESESVTREEIERLGRTTRPGRGMAAVCRAVPR